MNKLEKARLIEYHLTLATGLEFDLNENEDGYSGALKAAVCKKYNTEDWKVAYKKAYEYHDKRATELLTEFEKEFGEDYYDTYQENENEINTWVEKHVVLGEEPKA